MKKTFKRLLILLLAFSALTSCVEPYQLETTNFESALVIEATITNELKNQEIKVSKTYKFEENGPTFENGAHVSMTDDQGTIYDFHEQSDKYLSNIAFQAVAGRSYTLNIVLADGKSYRSTPETLTAINQIESVVPQIFTTPEGVRGVNINVNSFDPTGNSKYYRYEYEETYKIIAPKWGPENLSYDSVSDSFITSFRTEETKTCYSTKSSVNIIQTNTNNLSEDRVSNFPVRFINDQDFIIANRYSILVKQYVQNLQAYTFYNTLNQLSESESLLSQAQPGFFFGNIRAVENPSEKVIGFFDVSYMSQKRIFFNYNDVFPGEPLPPYFDDCEIIPYDISIPADPGAQSFKDLLILQLQQNTVRYFYQAYPIYYVVIPQCGDCTSFSSNIIPSFWED